MRSFKVLPAALSAVLLAAAVGRADLPLIGPGGVEEPPAAAPANPTPVPLVLFACKFKGETVPLLGNQDLTEFRGSVVDGQGRTLMVVWKPRTLVNRLVGLELQEFSVDILNVVRVPANGDPAGREYWDYFGTPVKPVDGVGSYQTDEWTKVDVVGAWPR